MRQSLCWPPVGLLLIFLVPGALSKICEVSKENYFRLNPLLNTMINSKYTSESHPASILLPLKLVGIQDQSLNQQLFQQIKSEVKTGLNLSLGNLALIILALGACHMPDEVFFIRENHLINHLEDKFQAEIEYMEVHSGNPLTNYYQLSTGLLALCLFNGKYSLANIAELFAPENKNYYFGGQFSVDTGAMAVLALTCVKSRLIQTQTKMDEEVLERIDDYLRSLVKMILSEIKENGLIGNAFSTGTAMQALFVSTNYYRDSEWDCQQTLDTVLKEISQGTFNIPIAAAHILPALLGKTYLGVNEDAPCIYNSGNFTQAPAPEITPASPSYISVHYSVKIKETFSTKVTVPSGSVFLDVMEEAQKQNETAFRFTMEQSSWGPYITSVQGLKANSNDRTYWELLSEGKSLSQGVGNYVVHNGEHLEVCWSTY